MTQERSLFFISVKINDRQQHNQLTGILMGTKKKETAWLFKVDMTDSRGKCTKRSVQIARKSAKFLLSPEETVQFTAKNAIQNEKIAAVKRGVNWHEGSLGC